MEGSVKLKNENPDLLTCDMHSWRPVKASQKWQFRGKITPLMLNFHKSSIKVQQITPIEVFTRISWWSVPLQRNASSLYPLQKIPTFSPPLCAPLAQGAKISTRAIWLLPESACKILSGSVKVCRSYSRKADFQQIRISCHAMLMTTLHGHWEQ